VGGIKSPHLFDNSTSDTRIASYVISNYIYPLLLLLSRRFVASDRHCLSICTTMPSKTLQSAYKPYPSTYPWLFSFFTSPFRKLSFSNLLDAIIVEGTFHSQPSQEQRVIYEMLKSVAFSLPCRLYIAPIIRSSDVEYQAYHRVHHS
jgi:hypothetical protein